MTIARRIIPVGQILRDVHWESHDNRTRLPSNLANRIKKKRLEGNLE